MQKIILYCLIMLSGILSCLTLTFGKKETVCKMFLLEVDNEDYKKIRLFGILISSIIFIIGATLFTACLIK